MKNKLIMFVQVLVSVVILAYLFNSIFEGQATDKLKPLVTGNSAAVLHLGLRPDQIESIRANCVMANRPTGINLKMLPLHQRLPVIWGIGPVGLWAVFRTISVVWFFMAVLCMGVVCLVGTIRWQLILRVQGLDLKFSRAVSIFFVGMFFNAFLLGSTGGDVIKAWYVAHETHHKKAEAVITVIVDRLIGLLVLFVIALVMMCIFYHRVFEDKRLIGFSIFTLAVVVVTITGTILGLWKGFADKLPGLRAWLKKLPKYDMLERMVNAYRVYVSHPSVLVKTVLQSVCVHFFSMFSIICVAKGLHITAAGFVDYFLYLPIINSLAAVPISFSGFGVREGMYVGMFAQVHMPEVQALALSLIGYLASLVWSLVGGIFFLTHRKEIPPATQFDIAE